MGDICIIYVPESRFFLGGRAKSIAAIQGETSAAMKSDFTCKAVFSWWKGQANCSHIRTRGKNCSHDFGLNLQGKLWRGTDVSYMCPNRCFFLGGRAKSIAATFGQEGNCSHEFGLNLQKCPHQELNLGCRGHNATS